MNADINIAFREVLLKTFKDVIDFLNENGLRWYAAYGTILGAIRHKGLIPWDDDIDIYMPRDDYNKLLAISGSLSKTNISLLTYHNVGYIYSFGKFINNKTTLWEQKEFPFVTGVYIDVFPLDLTYEENSKIEQNYKKYAKHLRCLQSVYQHHTIYSYMRCVKYYGLSWIKDNLYSKLFPNKAIKKFIEFDNSLNTDSGDKFVRYAVSGYAIYPKIWFNTFYEVPFENLIIRIPSGYKELLEQCYGDYMILPPLEKRISAHTHYYLNLKESLSIQEVMNRISTGEYLVY